MTTDLVARGHRDVERACADATSVVDLCRTVRAAIDTVVPSDRWCGFAVDPSTLFATNGFHEEGVALELVPRLIEIEYGEVDAGLVHTLARSRQSVTTIAAATGGDPSQSARWRDVIVPSGLAHELRAVFRGGDTVWGAMALFRGPDLQDFSSADTDFVRRVAPVVAGGFRRVMVRQHVEFGEDAREAGIIVLGGEPIEIITATPAARAWLGELDDSAAAEEVLPTVVLAAARGARRQTGAVAARARTREGRWLTITAERTDQGPTGTVGIVVQPSRPAEIAQIIGAAYGLTERERGIVLLVASGHTNLEIARRLGLSKYTVVDHLKNVFSKLGVASRGELTSRLYRDYYLDRSMRGSPVGVHAWFLDPVPDSTTLAAMAEN